jgi:hypothetical protein
VRVLIVYEEEKSHLTTRRLQGRKLALYWLEMTISRNVKNRGNVVAGQYSREEREGSGNVHAKLGTKTCLC